MDHKYYLKYLEYKNKYLALKGGMVGGISIEECENLLEKRNTKYLSVRIPISNDYNILGWKINKLNEGTYKNDYPKLQKLTIEFLDSYNQSNLNVNIFPESLQKLQIYNYKKELVQGVFPESLKYLDLNMKPKLEYTIPENVLPENLETLILTGEKIKITSLPKNLKNLSLHTLDFISEIKEIPETITTLKIGYLQKDKYDILHKFKNLKNLDISFENDIDIINEKIDNSKFKLKLEYICITTRNTQIYMNKNGKHEFHKNIQRNQEVLDYQETIDKIFIF